jgi:hypothetical protein
MTYVDDEEIRHHLISIAPDEKDVIMNTKFGEIKGS